MSTCNCMGPQNGEALCPCQMRAARQYAERLGWKMFGTLTAEEIAADKTIIGSSPR